MMKTTYCKRV